MRHVSFLVLLLPLACATLLGRATDLHGQMQALINKENANPRYFGHLAPGVTRADQLESRAHAEPFNTQLNVVSDVSVRQFGLEFVSMEQGELCFDTGLAPGDEKDHQREVEVLHKWTLVPEARTSLEIAANEPWPTPPPAGRQTIRTYTRGGDVIARICTQAPVVTPQTAFLTVAMLASGAEFANYLLVFDFKGQHK
jgi:hypothetical protein